MDKKGKWALRELGGILLAIVFFIGVFYFTYDKLYAEVPQKFSDEACLQSVYQSSFRGPAGIQLFSDLRCEQNLIEFDYADEEIAYDIIAQQMLRCWKNFGQGKLDFLGSYHYDKPDSQYDHYCFVCADFYFPNNVNLNSNSFKRYLETYPLDSDVKYSNAIGEVAQFYVLNYDLAPKSRLVFRAQKYTTSPGGFVDVILQGVSIFGLKELKEGFMASLFIEDNDTIERKCFGNVKEFPINQVKI